MSSDSTADQLFGLLADETRVDILRAAAIAEHELQDPGSGSAQLSFSDIYERVDVDNTSKLSYHLGKLTGSYLRKEGDGYSLTHAGESIVRFILSGNYQQPAEFGPESISGTCLFCGERKLEASLSHRFFQINCTACEKQVAGQPVTPAQTAVREGEDLVESVQQKNVRDYRAIRGELCPECSGLLATDIIDMRESALPDAESFIVRSQCQQCLREYNSPLTYSVAYHPASVAFHWDRGVDVMSMGVWEFHEFLHQGRWKSEQLSSSPELYEVLLRHDTDAIRFRLDSTASVTRTERVRRESGSQSDK